LIGLRLVIGFHFLNEGLEKLVHPKPFSAVFLENAKGPFAGWMGGQVWDADGLARLGYTPGADGSPFPTIETAETRDHWESFRQRIVAHYALDGTKEAESKRVLRAYEELLDAFVADTEPDVIEYFSGIERRERYRGEAWRHEVATLRGQLADVESKLKTKRGPLLAQVDAMWSGLERDLNAIGATEGGRRALRIGRLRPGALDSVVIDAVIPWFDLVVGASLLTGLAVRVSGTFAALFLAMVVASQFPGSPGSAPTWYQAIEMVALFHLAAIGGGRWGGLDAILAQWCCRKCRSKRGT